jgi:hypothetical protein
MGQRHWLSALVLAGAASGLISCGRSDNSAQTEANPAPNAAAAQMNISGPQPVVLGPDTIQAEIDKAGSGVKLVPLDLSTVGLPLSLEAPEGAKVEGDPRELLLRRDCVDVEITAGDHFALRIRLGKRPFDQKRHQMAGQQVLVNTKDLVLSTSMLLLDERCEFARHVVAGLQDYTIENVDPLLGQQVNHSQADCLLMLKCAGTLAPRMAPPADPAAALQQFHATLVKGADGQIVNVTLDPRQTTDATLTLAAKLPALERLILHRCPITDDGLAHLAGLTRLKELNLADCPITDAGLSSLSKLTNLEVLNLASSFGDSPQIKGHGLAALASLTKLQVLVLDKNLVDDAGLSALQNVKSLRELYLEQTRVLGPGLASLRGLRNLKVLSLNETKIADAGLEGLRDVAGLEVLNLRGSLVRGDGIKHLHGLKNLHTLNLGNTPMSDACLTNLEGLKRLKRLALAGTTVTEAAADKLKKALPGVEVALK